MGSIIWTGQIEWNGATLSDRGSNKLYQTKGNP